MYRLGPEVCQDRWTDVLEIESLEAASFKTGEGVSKAYSTCEQLGLWGDHGELWESLRLVGEEKGICASGAKINNHINLGR